MSLCCTFLSWSICGLTCLWPPGHPRHLPNWHFRLQPHCKGCSLAKSPTCWIYSVLSGVAYYYFLFDCSIFAGDRTRHVKAWKVWALAASLAGIIGTDLHYSHYCKLEQNIDSLFRHSVLECSFCVRKHSNQVHLHSNQSKPGRRPMSRTEISTASTPPHSLHYHWSSPPPHSRPPWRPA